MPVAEIVGTQHETYRAAGIKYMSENIAGEGCIVSKPEPMKFKTHTMVTFHRWRR